jgi:hypothetical protein
VINDDNIAQNQPAFAKAMAGEVNQPAFAKAMAGEANQQINKSTNQ